MGEQLIPTGDFLDFSSEDHKRVLLIATVVKTHVMHFHISWLKKLKELGYETAVAAKNDYDNPNDCQIPYCDHFFDIPFKRFPFHPSNIRAFRKLKKIMREQHYDVIHCHTPVGGVLGRLSAMRSRRLGTKVFYTAHGFHFYKGAPLKNWIMYYPVEKLCAHFTDILITINKEDYELAKRKLKAKQIEYVPGVGIDTKKFSDCNIDRAEKRKEFGVPENATLLMSVGELNGNKNHEIVIKALASLNDSDIYYIIAGKGEREKKLLDRVKNLGLEKNVRLLGYRSDIAELYKASDICVFPSIREGLGLAAIEGMAAGLPLLVADNRGTRDFCVNNVNGLVCSPFSVDEFANAIRTLNTNPELCEKYGDANKSKATDFDLSIINEMMNKIYFCSDKKGEECE